MIRQELRDELDSIASRLDENDNAEAATKTILLTTLAAVHINQEFELMMHVRRFAKALKNAITVARARRN